ncbi:MAG: cupredoxin domain-containing protein [Myxococcota bacterium]
MLRRPVLVMILFVLAVSLVACGGRNRNAEPDPMPNDGMGASGGGAGTPTVVRKSVLLYRQRFNPNSLTIPVGGIITFTNKDPMQHNVSISSLRVDRMLNSNETFEQTFSQPGTYTITNRLANTPMKATVIVR